MENGTANGTANGTNGTMSNDEKKRKELEHAEEVILFFLFLRRFLTFISIGR